MSGQLFVSAKQINIHCELLIKWNKMHTTQHMVVRKKGQKGTSEKPESSLSCALSL